jgi:hypothetical protein
MVRFDTYNASAHLVRQLEDSGAATVKHDGADNLLIQLKTGDLVSIYLIETVIPPYEIKATLLDNANSDIATLFILWGDMFLHSEDQYFRPDEWLKMLFALHNNKVYAFETFGKDIRIFPVYLESNGDLCRVRYGSDVDVTKLGCVTTHVNRMPSLHGQWLIADFAGTQRQEKQRQTPPIVIKSTPWDVLGLAPVRDRELVKTAYRRLARLYHPDVNRSPDATAHMQRLNQAYTAILNELDQGFAS